jgi:cytoskeletal protein RodZ
VSIGEALAEARRQSGLTITQVSQQTRIRESMIRAIEQGDFSMCGGDFYARGHIRSIAGVVGTDPVPLIREYDEEHGPPGAISAADVFEPSTPIKIRDPRPFPLGKVLAAAVVAAAAFGVYQFMSGSPARAPASPVAAVRSTVTATPSHRPIARQPARPAYPPGQATIVLTAKANCWVGITDTSGKQIFTGTVSAGQSKTWLEKQQVNVRLGNPSGVHLTVNGKNETPNTANPATVYVNPANTAQVASTGGIPVTTH